MAKEKAQDEPNCGPSPVGPVPEQVPVSVPVSVPSAAVKLTTKKPKPRSTPYVNPKNINPILLSGERRSLSRKKSLKWLPDERLKKIHYFEYIADERANVAPNILKPTSVEQQQIDSNASAIGGGGGGGPSVAASVNKMPSVAGGKIVNSNVDPIRRPTGKSENEKWFEYLPWPRSLILIEFKPDLPAPGWRSTERTAQAERETYVLGAIDLPGQPSTIDEPDQQIKPNGTCVTDVTKEDEIKIIPSENAEGMYTEYSDMYNSECVNGIKLHNDEPASIQNIGPFCSQQSQLLQNQFQQQLVSATQNPFNFQDMGAQFQQPAQMQMQIQFPFQQQQSIHPGQQQQVIPFTSQQQIQVPMQQQQSNFVDQQAGIAPVMPWLSFPFNQVNENTHAHLFKRPAT